VKNRFKLLVIAALLAAIAFSIAACGDGDNGSASGSGGTLTLTDIPAEYNGKYVRFEISERGNGDLIIGGIYKQPEGFTMPVFFNVQIKNGRAVIPLYNNYTDGERYTWDDTFFYNWGWNNSNPPEPWISITADIHEKEWAKYSYEDVQLDWTAFSSITFTNGSATKSWNDGFNPSLVNGIVSGGDEWRNKVPTKLIGTWRYNGQVLFAIEANGTGSIEGQGGYKVQVRSIPQQVRFTQGSTEIGLFEFDSNGGGYMRIISGTGPFTKWVNLSGGFVFGPWEK